MANFSAPASQRPKGPTLGTSGWGQTGPWRRARQARKGEGTLVLTLYSARALQVMSPTQSYRSCGSTHLCTHQLQGHPALPHPYSYSPAPQSGRRQNGGASPTAIPCTRPLCLLPLCPPAQTPYLMMVSPAGHTPKSRNGEPAVFEHHLEPS